MKEKLLLALLTSIMLFVCSCGEEKMAQKKDDFSFQNEPDFKLGVQTWTFNRFTFYEAVDKIESLGLHYMEAYAGQTLSKDNPEAKFGPGLSAQQRQEIKNKLAKANIKLMSMGVICNLDNDEAKYREFFEFAKDMNIRMIMAEPYFESFDMIETLCEEYQIKVAIHNHARQSGLPRYWHPDIVLEKCKDSEWLGACPDTGHWMRSGLNPIEMLKKCEGEIYSVHLKDLNKFAVMEAHDVPWGTGTANIKAILAELKRQCYKGTFFVEYEHNWEHSLPDIKKSVDYFNTAVNQL